MASSMIHLAITTELIRQHEFKDVDRLRLGSILPDAAKRGNGHLKVSVCGNNKKTYDLERFKSMFGEFMKTDDLYLGYYLHLIQDLVYRHFVYDEYHWNPFIPGNVDRLHKDYRICNYYIAAKYGVDQNIKIPEFLDQERIHELADFDTDSFAQSVREQFVQVDGDVFFFTKEMAEEYIEKAVAVCIQELNAFEQGGTTVDAYKQAWRQVPKSLLKTTLNTRELGGFRSNTGRFTVSGKIFRSDVQNYPSEEDIDFLKRMKITTIIDMRGIKDAQRKPSGFAGVEGFTYVNIPIEEGSDVPESTEAVPESYLSIACAANMPDVLKAIAVAPEGVMFNCTAGKDRTGVLSALLLGLCGVSREDIVFDYMLTKECNAERFELIHKNFPDIDMNIVIPHEEYMYGFWKLMDEKYGDVERFLESIGVTGEEQAAIKGKMLSDRA